MEELINKDSFTSLELVELINKYRVEEGNRNNLRHDNLLKIIRDEFSTKEGILKIKETPYIHPQNGQEYPMFILNLQQSRQVLLRESKFVRRAIIDYIDKLENQLKQKIELQQEKSNLLLTVFDGGLDAVYASKKLVEIETQYLQKEITFKEDIIIGLVDNIDLATKRQRLNQIIRKGKNYQDRWSVLYNEFEKKYHVNLSKRIESCEIKPKIKNKLDYIDRVMDKVDALYELACKIYQNDVEKLKEEWFNVISLLPQNVVPINRYIS